MNRHATLSMQSIRTSLRYCQTILGVLDAGQFVAMVILNAMEQTTLIVPVRYPQLHASENSTLFGSMSYGHGVTMARFGSIHVEWLLSIMILLTLPFRLFALFWPRVYMRRIRHYSNLARWLECALSWTCMTIVAQALNINSTLNDYITSTTSVWISAMLFWLQEEWNAVHFRFFWKQEGLTCLDPREEATWSPFVLSELAGLPMWLALLMTLGPNMQFIPAYVTGALFVGFFYSQAVAWIQGSMLKTWLDDHSRRLDAKTKLLRAYASSEIWILLVGFVFRTCFAWLILGLQMA
jgi:hypothetical protein